jgi:hypothetical protein
MVRGVHAECLMPFAIPAIRHPPPIRQNATADPLNCPEPLAAELPRSPRDRAARGPDRYSPIERMSGRDARAGSGLEPTSRPGAPPTHPPQPPHGMAGARRFAAWRARTLLAALTGMLTGMLGEDDEDPSCPSPAELRLVCKACVDRTVDGPRNRR